MTHSAVNAPEIELATARDVRPIAALHIASLPDSMISMLGPAAVERYYDLVTTSATEHVFVARAGGLAAACVLTLEPQTVMGRFVRHAPLRFAADLARQSLAAAFRRRLLARLEEAGDSAGPGVPEVTQIFTDAAQRGRGLGSALLRACEDRLRALGQNSYCIHTLRNANDAGIRFYRREGFTDSGTSRSFGDDYLIMTKGLT